MNTSNYISILIQINITSLNSKNALLWCMGVGVSVKFFCKVPRNKVLPARQKQYMSACLLDYMSLGGRAWLEGAYPRPAPPLIIICLQNL